MLYMLTKNSALAALTDVLALIGVAYMVTHHLGAITICH
jgi:hypothetical protein